MASQEKEFYVLFLTISCSYSTQQSTAAEIQFRGIPLGRYKIVNSLSPHSLSLFSHHCCHNRVCFLNTYQLCGCVLLFFDRHAVLTCQSVFRRVINSGKTRQRQGGVTSGGEEFDKGVYIMLLVIVYVQCFVLCVCACVCSRLQQKISLTFLQSRGRRSCRRRLMTSPKTYRRRRTKGDDIISGVTGNSEARKQT